MTGTPNAEYVRLRCPLCRWESHEAFVEDQLLNGLWVARQSLMAAYRSHLTNTHWPDPELVQRAQIDGSERAS